MKKSKNIILSVLLAVCAVCLCFALIGCSGGGDDKNTGKYGYGEEGFYYYDGADSSRYMLSLQSGTYMITVNNSTAYSGSYSYDEESGKVSFSGDNEFAATLGESALSLNMEGSGYSFKAYKFFDVTYVDETGKTVAVESVLNGQSAEALDIEKDGYWFVGWYEGADNAAEFAFDSAIAGDTTVYGWYIEKNLDAAEYDVTYDYGDGYTETASTQNGAVWKLPSSYDGRAIIGWWVSAVNSGDALTYKYDQGDVLTSDTTLFAVYGGLGASVTIEGITWDAESAGASVSVTVTDENGEAVISESSVSSSSGSYTSSAFSELGTGTYTVEVASGSVKDTLIYVVNGLSRVSLSSADIVVSGGGRVISFAPVEGADGYVITVTNGERSLTEDLGSHTYYNFSAWDMTKDGITFVVTAYADGFVSSVSEAYTYLMILDSVTVEISDDVVYWNRVSGALEYEVTITGEGLSETFSTANNSFSLKYYGAGTYDISVQPKTDGYFSEVSTYYGYGKLTLAAPAICDITDYSISWTDVGAESYVVNVAGTEIPVPEGTTLLLSEDQIPAGFDSYEISVKACAATGDSPYSDALVVTNGELKASLSYDRNTVYWSYDLAAAEYVVSVNGEKTYTVTEGNSLEIELTRSGDNEISVTAYDIGGESIGYAVTSVYAYFVALSGEGAVTEKDFLYVAQGDALRLGTAEKEHASFIGWYTQPDFTEGQSDEYGGIGSEVLDGSTFTGSRDIYLYAYWSYEYIEVTLNIGTGVFSGGWTDETVKIKYHSTSYVLPTVTAEFETDDFVGWFGGQNGTGNQYVAGSGTKFEGETVLYAYYLTILNYEKTRYNGEDVYSVSAGEKIDRVTEVTIPENYKGYNLVLNSNAFRNCTTLVAIYIPDTVQYIAVTNDGYKSGTGAFAGCSNLLNVIIYEIGDEASSTKEPVYFSEEGVLFHKVSEAGDVELLYYPYGRSLTAYTVPSTVSNKYECNAFGSPIAHNVTTIPAHVFRERRIDEITIPATVTYVASLAFYENKDVQKIFFTPGEGDTLVIEEGAFRRCTSVSEITLPARYSSINTAVFTDCTSLLNVYIESGGVYGSENGILIDAANLSIVYYPSGRGGDIVISSLTSQNITTIGTGAFSYNTNITSVTFPASMTEIGVSAFEGCTSLKSIMFDGSEYTDLTIKSNAFYGCILLSEVRLPSNLTTMEKDAFGECTNLTYVYFDARAGADVTLNFANGSFGSTSYITKLELGANVPKISFVDIFGGDNLAEVVISEGNENYASDSYGAVYDADGKEILYYPLARVGAYEMLETATDIAANIFTNRVGLTSISIGASVETIASGAFSGCTNLTSITVDSQNQNYGSDSNGILYTKQGDALVELLCCPLKCSAKDVTVDETVTKVADNAFEGNGILEKITFTATQTFTLGESAFEGCTSLTNVILPESMTEISEAAFADCEKLVTVNIPEGVTKICKDAFNGCSSLIGNLSISGENGQGITLPETLVTIEDYAFYYDSKLAVTIPASVTSIGKYAFAYCWYDTVSSVEIVFEESETEGATLTIDQYAFYYTRNATSLNIPSRTTSLEKEAFGYFGYNETSETPITFGEGCKITSFGDYVFYYAKNVTNIVLPASVTSLSYQLFCGCSSLATISFAPEGQTSSLQTIGEYAFQNTALTSVEIPATVTEIKEWTFYNASSLEEVVFAEDCSLKTIGVSVFYGSGLKEIEIPESVETIGHGAFGNCKSLQSVSFESSDSTTGSKITTIEYASFWNCTSLESVTLPGNLINLGTGGEDYSDGVFSTCTSLETILIPASVETIGSKAFIGCTKLTSINFEEGCSLKEIQDSAFDGCTALTSFTFPESSAEYVKLGTQIFNGSGVVAVALSTNIFEGIGSAFQGLILSSITVADGNTNYKVDESGNPILYTIDTDTYNRSIIYVFGTLSGEVKVPEGVKSIGESAYYKQTAITSVEIPASVESIEEYAFYGCTGITEIVFENDSALTELGQYVFSGCSNLTKINLPDGLSELPVRCFENCDLSETVLPQSIKILGNYALYGVKMDDISLPNLESAGTYVFATSAISSINLGNTLDSLSNYTFQNCTSLTEIVLPSSLITIGQHAFDGCTSLAYIDIPASVTTINTYAFQYCAFETIKLPETITAINGYTFRYCHSLKTLDIPANVRTIDTYAFYDCPELMGLVLPDGLTTLGTYVFYGCKSIKSIEIPGGVTSLGSSAFYGCEGLEYIILPDNITSLGANCFQNCYALESVEMNGKLTTLNNSAFRYCTSLESIIVGSGVTSFGTYVFADCTSLTYAYTGDAASTLGNYMFYNCTNLTSVEFGPNVKNTGTYLFQNCTSLKDITLPSGLTTIGTQAFDGCTGIEYLVIPSSVSSVAKQAFTGCRMSLYIENSPDYVSIYWTPNTTDTNTWDSGFTNGSIYYLSVNEPLFNGEGTGYADTENNYWHYDEDGEIVKWEFGYTTYTVETGGYVLYSESDETISYVCISDEDRENFEVFAVSECASDTSDGTYSVTLASGESYTVVLTDTDGVLTATVTAVTD